MSTRVLSVASQATAAVRGAAPKRGFSSISRASYSLSSSSSSSTSDEDTVEIPEVLNSQETLEFCGLTPEVSSVIFDSWRRLQQNPGQLGSGNDIVIEAKHYVRKMAEREGDAWLPEHDWRRALTAMGVSQRLSDAILNTNYTHVRKTASASHWALDTIDLAWEFLEGLDKRIRKKQNDNARELVTPSPSVLPRPVIPNQQLGLISSYREPPVLKLATMSPVPQSIEGRTLLYKGGSMTRLVKVFKDDGSLDIHELSSTPPTDFHRQRETLLYLSKHYDVAQTYANFAADRVPAEEGAILHFAVPSALLEDGIKIFGPDWQQLVFWSRGRYTEDVDSVPTHLAHYTQAPLLIGCIYGMPNQKVARLESPPDLTGQYMKTRSGGNALQHCFQTKEIKMRLQEECKGWVWYQSMRYNRDMGYRFLPTDES
ncbi:hypothetical protein B0T25DRAFT_60868 [Lasiosphaeria hispida]|uniref:Uncharacterized protein n=1 Tax=Lasiosphaeria hispida TaxID=260671 RepID=A0AAJ0HX34_9PEZI|nr:hypothetical protein B0T25DRAFT_60868 [Lasiosphaeria hispida]